MYFSTNDAIYFGAICVAATGGLVANALLLYLIIYRSPKHLSPYRILLGNTALTQLLLAAVIFAIAPRVLTDHFYIANIYLGPSQLLGPWCSYMLYLTMLHLALNSFMSLMVSMIYRCIVLRVSTISTSSAVLMCLAGYVLPFSMLASSVNLDYSANITKAAELTHYLVPHMDKYSVVVTVSILQLVIFLAKPYNFWRLVSSVADTTIDDLSSAPCAMWTIFCCSFLLIPIYATMYYCRWKILTFIEKSGVVQSSSTRLNTKRLVKALTIQSLVPTLSIFPPAIAYLLIQFGILGPQLFSYFIAPCLSIASNASDTNLGRSQTSKARDSPTRKSINITVPL
ncbi:7TM chemoreceptor [Ancylostoma ceylanicum]|uniref:7TM chemoreceptor n=1 Tax=Ancylostoma ceylanicum TaxID=53326 RepID=A0A0D6M2F9_9BILA|nr:7TM chemoreceptor [Ancylostoma ceylanicum]